MGIEWAFCPADGVPEQEIKGGGNAVEASCGRSRGLRMKISKSWEQRSHTSSVAPVSMQKRDMVVQPRS